MKLVGSIKLLDNNKSKKKYSISFEYDDEKGRKHRASVRFGLKK